MCRHLHAYAVALVVGAGVVLGSCGGGPTDPDPPPPPPAVTLASLVLNPSTVAGCATSQITATLSGPAPAGGTTVALTSGNATAVSVPTSLSIAAGATSGTATATPGTVTASTSVSITGAVTGTASQSASLTLGAPIANFSVSGTARGADACQLRNSGGQVDCTFNGAASMGASRWRWEWQVGTTSGGPTETTTPTFQPTTACSLFASGSVGGTPGNTFVGMTVRLTVLDATARTSCVTQNANIRVFSGGFCGGF